MRPASPVWRGCHWLMALAGVAICLFGIGGFATAQAAESVGGAWRIEQARSEPILDKRHARLDFGADGRLSGHTSCNELNASYTLEGRALRVGPIATTRKSCPPLQMEQEDRILTALELVATAAVRLDGLLELRDAEGRGLLRATRFEPSHQAGKRHPSK